MAPAIRVRRFMDKSSGWAGAAGLAPCVAALLQNDGHAVDSRPGHYRLCTDHSISQRTGNTQTMPATHQ